MPRLTKQQKAANAAILDVQDHIIQGIRAIAPKLTEQDVRDLTTLTPMRLRMILGDYKLAKVLNQPEISLIIQFINEIKPFTDLLCRLVRIL